MGGGKCPSPFCSVRFTTGKGKRRHVFREEHGDYVQCTVCNEPFLSERARQQHMDSIDHSRVKVRFRVKQPKQSIEEISGAILFPEKMASMMSTPTRQTDLYTFKSRTELNSFLAEKIQPQSSFLDSNSSTVDTIVRHLQGHLPEELKPARIVKVGSLGKGTTVNENSDIDVTVVLEGIKDMQTYKSRRPTILSSLEKCLRKLDDVTLKDGTYYAVQLEIDGHSVDILPAMNIDIFNDSSLRKLYEAMSQIEKDNRLFSSTLSPLQLEIIKHLPTKLKSLIRLIKYWQKTKLTEIPKVPVSYVMELVVINAWQNNGSCVDFDMLGALKTVLTNLVNHHAFRVEFESIRKYPAGMARVGSGPYIIDPTNPFNDVYHGLFETAWNWEGVAREARRWLGMPLFNGVSSTW